MADYAKKKNDELAAICKERGLPHTGKKADLVKRLEEYDSKQSAEDELNFDDEPATETANAATTEPAANAIAAGGQGEVSNPQAVPNQEAAIDPAQTNDLKVEAAPVVEEPKTEESIYKQGLLERTLDEEIEKRKARARRFGMPEDTDEIKALERAKRFGTDLPGLLNKALPADMKREKKRGVDGADNDGGIRKRSRGRAAPEKKQGSEQVGSEKTEKKENGGYPSWMSAADIAKAEQRKAKFAQT
jgi:SAP domain-containing ribonucleoprotein